MGVKSTVRLTRQEAEDRYVQFKLDRKRPKYEAMAKEKSDEDLELLIERWNDEAYDGQGFDNYSIVASHDED